MADHADRAKRRREAQARLDIAQAMGTAYGLLVDDVGPVGAFLLILSFAENTLAQVAMPTEWALRTQEERFKLLAQYVHDAYTPPPEPAADEPSAWTIW